MLLMKIENIFLLISIVCAYEFNETLYNILKEKAKFKVKDIETLKLYSQLTNNKEEPIKEISKSWTFSKKINESSLEKLTKKEKFLSEKLPSNYNFEETYGKLQGRTVTECKSSSVLSILEALSFKILKNENKKVNFAINPIFEYFKNCSELSALQVLNYTNNNGLNIIEGCESDEICDEKKHKLKKKIVYKTQEPYLIEGEENIKKEIYNNGPVITDIDIYEDYLYYDSGVYEHCEGEYLGTQTVVLTGWDENGHFTALDFSYSAVVDTVSLVLTAIETVITVVNTAVRSSKSSSSIFLNYSFWMIGIVFLIF